MSRAFVKEDRDDQRREYHLPEPGSSYFDEACAMALIAGANEGDKRSAELATGFNWGERRLAPHVQRILKRAEAEGEDRVAQLCRRFLRTA